MPSHVADVCVAERVMLETDIERRHREKRVRKIVRETPWLASLMAMKTTMMISKA